MSIQKRTRSEWIRIDNGYLSRIHERQKLAQEKPHLTIGTGPKVDAAISELHDEVMVHYLPARFPTIFQASKSKGLVKNLATGAIYPMTDLESVITATVLTYMSENVEGDFYFM